jgi:hypothetical protein
MNDEAELLPGTRLRPAAAGLRRGKAQGTLAGQAPQKVRTHE